MKIDTKTRKIMFNEWTRLGSNVTDLKNIFQNPYDLEEKDIKQWLKHYRNVLSEMNKYKEQFIKITFIKKESL